METIIKNLINEMNVVVEQHNCIKNEIIQLTNESDLITIEINKKIEQLHIIEKEYVRIVTELNNNNGI